MSSLFATFRSELEEVTYDLVESAFRQEPSVSIDRLLPLGNHDSQTAVTLGDRSVGGISPFSLSRSQAFVHHEPGNLQPKPFR
jgi:hypothetical protein